MDINILRKDLKSITSSLDFFLEDGMTRLPWFMSFGSLLYMIRDMRHGVEFNQDVDISIRLEGEAANSAFREIKKNLERNGWRQYSVIKESITNEILFSSFVSENGLHLDLFFWIKVDDNYYHTYDYMNEKQMVPTNYHFKSLPAWMFEGSIVRHKFPGDEDLWINVPIYYGSMLDYWYNNWFIPNPEYGVSDAEHIANVPSYKNARDMIRNSK